MKNVEEIAVGDRLEYADGREGNGARALCTVLDVDAVGMVVQFDDRADTTRIVFADAYWMRFMRFAEVWRDEFGSGFAVPAAVTLHPGIVDTSWGNDAAPTFTLGRYERAGDLPGVSLWADHPDREERENRQEARFLVIVNPPDYDPNKFETLYEGNDVEEALRALEGIGEMVGKEKQS